MPSNVKLIEQARKLAAKLELTLESREYTLDDESNANLTALVKDLKAKAKDAETVTAADGAAAAADTSPVVDGASDEPDAVDPDEIVAEAAPVRVEVKPELEVAPGKAITCKKGVLVEGDEVKPEWFGGGRDAVMVLIKSGHVVVNG